jgi:2-hydroxy-3-oxopropionate reductase
MKTIGFIGLGIMGKELGVPIPLSGQVLEIMQALKTDGKAREDHSGLVQFYEQLAKVKVRQ